MEEGCFPDAVYVCGAHDDSEVSDQGGGSDIVTIDAKKEVLGGGDDVFWAEDDNFSFIVLLTVVCSTKSYHGNPFSLLLNVRSASKIGLCHVILNIDYNQQSSSDLGM